MSVLFVDQLSDELFIHLKIVFQLLVLFFELLNQVLQLLNLSLQKESLLVLVDLWYGETFAS